MSYKDTNQQKGEVYMTEQQFSLLLQGNMVRYERTLKNLCQCIGVTDRTLSNYIKYPDTMRVSDLKRLTGLLKIRTEDLIDFLEGKEY